jgi:hypothetical protein
MNNEDKRLISEYMGWRMKAYVAHVLNTHKDFVFTTCDNGYINIHFNLNDAGLCVKKMQRQEDWDDFITYVEADDTSKQCNTWSQFFALLYNADYFFEAMAAWLKEEKR